VAHMKEVVLGRSAGPYPSPPFPNTRIVPNGLVPKDKYDEASDRVRITCDPSALHSGSERGSINNLTWSPRLLSAHLSADRLRDSLAWLHTNFGPGIEAWTADVPSCFRCVIINAALLFLFTYAYRVVTAEFGVEFFSDLCNVPRSAGPSGAGSAYSGLSQWYALLEGFPDLEAYVDNFFLFSHPGLHHVHSERCKGIEEVFAALGIPLHERMVGSSFKGLG
jgi:hypothetical protein